MQKVKTKISNRDFDCAQERLESVRSRLQAGAAALLTDASGAKQHSNGVTGLPQGRHAAVSAVAGALAELQRLESDSVDSGSTGASCQISNTLIYTADCCVMHRAIIQLCR